MVRARVVRMRLKPANVVLKRVSAMQLSPALLALVFGYEVLILYLSFHFRLAPVCP